ncbi:GIY-YIG nuclease family protein [Aeromicrobium sp. CFBP 8757]|uniref:GIY-YIG nuclease family protein n=1 Tax=Aeromicrobium sp. CFBP 8757 TaxID=2775288 RepID=UPI0035300216
MVGGASDRPGAKTSVEDCGGAVHAHSSHDAVGIETMSHQTFAGHRFNKVNLSREFFRGTPEQALDVLKAHSVEVLGL